MGSFSDADKRSAGSQMSCEERFCWMTKMVRSAFGWHPDEKIPFDKTAFSMRKTDRSER